MNCNIILKNEKIFEKLLTKSKMIIIIISEQKFEKTYKEMETVIMITNLHIKNIGIIDDLEMMEASFKIKIFPYPSLFSSNSFLFE